MTDVVVLAAILAVVSLIRGRIASWPLTTPILFVCAGMLLGPDGLGALAIELDDESVTLAAEVTLAMLLFSDAARIDTTTLRTSIGFPARLLGIGLPLSIALGTVLTGVLLVDLSWSEAALVAAILAPTDAALGQAVVSDTRVPVRIRQALNVESGLNDGLVVPVVAVFSALAVGDELESAGSLIGEAFTEVALGVLIGALAGVTMGVLMTWVAARQWTDADGLRLVSLGGALAGFAGAVAIGGNGFIAAFVCGIALHLAMGEKAGHHAELAEDIGQIGASATFVIFGAVMVIPAFGALGWAVALCAVGTLTLGRMVPVRLAMIGTGLRNPTVAFMGWFGPRGLASMLFGMLLVAERGPEVDELFSIIALVVFASVILHGITAAPGARVYSQWFTRHGRPEMCESMIVPETRLRWARRGPASSDSAPPTD